jgi:glycosyltransferase involved in cell wall biosynthesis
VKIVRVIARLNTGGPTVHTVLLTAGLNAGAFRSVLVTGVVPPGEGDMSYFAEQHGVTPVVIPALSRLVGLRGIVTAYLRLLGIVRRERPDIVHTHTATAGMLGRAAAWTYNVAAWLRGRPRCRIVHTFHGHVFHGYFSPARSRALVVIERILARMSDRILTVSDSVERDLVERYRIGPASKIGVVPLGLDFGWVTDVPLHTGVLRRELGIPAPAITVGMIGRLTGIKNHELLLEAASRLRRPDVRIVLVGDGERRADLERRRGDLGLEDAVIFAGWRRDPARIYADLDVVCLTSRNEGSPVALIEAMAAGRPIVATRVGGVRDLMLGEGERTLGFEVFANGILVPPDNAGAVAGALRYLADRPSLRQAMGSAGQAFALKQFSKERLLQDIESLYESLAGRTEGRE